MAGGTVPGSQLGEAKVPGAGLITVAPGVKMVDAGRGSATWNK